MAFISVTWHIMDDNACPICKELNNYTWTFEVGKNDLGFALGHPVHGVVWTIDEGSRAHGHKGNCRCHLTHEVDLKDIIEKVEQVRETVRAMVLHRE